mmetsp:Transcript_12972/g.36483  ORF Transcript_12972/g.36483 Transcript_12972/m.36483 type:complete len:273 (-) Transcript_12972:619-1437(-)
MASRSEATSASSCICGLASTVTLTVLSASPGSRRYTPRCQAIPPATRHRTLYQKSGTSSLAVDVSFSQALSTWMSPRPWVRKLSGSPGLTERHEFSRARRTAAGVRGRPSALRPLSSKAMQPQALGEAMLVPFISCRRCSVQLGTGATAPPGALSTTPRSPSRVGPREDQVYCCPSLSTSLRECPAAARSGETYAPTEMMAEVVPPGAPTVLRAGPLLPAEDTKMMPCLLTTSVAMSTKRPTSGVVVASPYDMLMRSAFCAMACISARVRPV